MTKTKFKGIAAILVMFAMAVTLCACGGGSEGDAGGKAGGETQAATLGESATNQGYTVTLDKGLGDLLANYAKKWDVTIDNTIQGVGETDATNNQVAIVSVRTDMNGITEPQGFIDEYGDDYQETTLDGLNGVVLLDDNGLEYEAQYYLSVPVDGDNVMLSIYLSDASDSASYETIEQMAQIITENAKVTKAA